jgi:hypothetical protein
MPAASLCHIDHFWVAGIWRMAEKTVGNASGRQQFQNNPDIPEPNLCFKLRLAPRLGGMPLAAGSI